MLRATCTKRPPQCPTTADGREIVCPLPHAGCGCRGPWPTLPPDSGILAAVSDSEDSLFEVRFLPHKLEGPLRRSVLAGRLFDTAEAWFHRHPYVGSLISQSMARDCGASCALLCVGIVYFGGLSVAVALPLVATPHYDDVLYPLLGLFCWVFLAVFLPLLRYCFVTALLTCARFERGVVIPDFFRVDGSGRPAPEVLGAAPPPPGQVARHPNGKCAPEEEDPPSGGVGA